MATNSNPFNIPSKPNPLQKPVSKPQESKSSPTGYTDKLGQPVSYNPSKAATKSSGSNKGSSNVFNTPEVVNPLVAPQTVSQEEQIKAKTLASQNIDAARNANQRDANYLINNRPSSVITTTKTQGGVLEQDPYKMSLASGFKQSFSNALNFGKIGQEGLGSYYRDIFVPFENTNFGMTKPNINPKYKGTTISEPGSVPFGYRDTSNMSYGQIKVNQDLAAGLPIDLVGLTVPAAESKIYDNTIKTYQNKIDSGSLGYTTEEEKTSTEDKFNKEVAERIKDYNKKQFDTMPLQEMEKTPAKFIKMGVETAATFAFGALPEVRVLGDLVLGRLGGEGYALASPESYLAKSFEKETIMPGLLKSKFGGKDLQIGKEIYQGEKGSAFTIDTFRTDPYKYAKQEVKFNILSFEKSTPDVMGFSESGVPTLIKKGDSLGISSFITKGRTNTRIYNPISDEIKTSLVEFGGGSKLGVIGKGFTYNTKGVSMSFKEADFGIGTGYIKIKGEEKFKQFSFLGTSKDQGEFYSVASGKPTKSLLGSNIKVRSNVNTFGKISKMDLSKDFGFSIQPSESLGFKGLGRTKNLGSTDMSLALSTSTKSIKPIGADTIINEASSLKGFEQITSKEFSSQRLIPSYYKSLYYGTGQYEKTSGGLMPKQSYEFKTNSKGLSLPSFSLGITTQESGSLSLKYRQGDSSLTSSNFAQPSAYKFKELFRQQNKQKYDLGLNNTMPNFNTDFGFKGFGFGSGIGDLGLPSLGGYDLSNRKRKGRKSRDVNIAPSFSALVLDLRMSSPLKVSKTFGVTPFQVRGKLVGKASKGNYFKLTNI